MTRSTKLKILKYALCDEKYVLPFNTRKCGMVCCEKSLVFICTLSMGHIGTFGYGPKWPWQSFEVLALSIAGFSLVL